MDLWNKRREQRDELFDRLAVVGKAFSSARRLALIDVLAQGERTVEELGRELGLGTSTVSAHLQILKAAHVVTTRREGTHIHYRLAGEDVLALYAAIQAAAATHSADVEQALAAYIGTGQHEGVEQITREELIPRLDGSGLTLVDVRPLAEYEAGHIPGALHLPLGDLVEDVDTLPAGTEVIAYCRGAWCVLAHDAVGLLQERGIRARRLEDGMLEWRSAGLPVEVAS